MSHLLRRLRLAHDRADRRGWNVQRRYHPTKKQHLIARDNAVFFRRMQIMDRQKRGTRIWWPRCCPPAYGHLFGRDPVALAEGSLTLKPRARVAIKVPFGCHRPAFDLIPF